MGGLTQFSDALSHKIGTIDIFWRESELWINPFSIGAFDKNISNITGSIQANAQSIKSHKKTLEDHEREIKILASEVEEHSSKIDYLMNFLAG